MPLTTWTEQDELLSEALHMMDVAQGLDRPSIVKTADTLKDGRPVFTHQDDERQDEAMPPAERKLAGHTHSRVQAHRDMQLIGNSPIMTCDSTDIHAAMAGAVKSSRWADGKACGVSIEYEDAHLAVSVEEVHECVDDEGQVYIETVGYNEPGKVLIERVPFSWEEEENLSPKQVRINEARAACASEIPASRLKSYVETALFTNRREGLPVGLAFHVNGGRFWPASMLYERVKDDLVARGLQRRALRPTAPKRMHADAFDLLRQRPLFGKATRAGAEPLPERGDAAERSRARRAERALDAAVQEQVERDYVMAPTTLYKPRVVDGTLVMAVGRPGREKQRFTEPVVRPARTRWSFERKFVDGQLVTPLVKVELPEQVVQKPKREVYRDYVLVGTLPYSPPPTPVDHPPYAGGIKLHITYHRPKARRADVKRCTDVVKTPMRTELPVGYQPHIGPPRKLF